MGVHTEAIQKLYVAYFARPADVAGLTYWEGVLAQGGATIDGIAARFADSPEYRALYAGKTEYQIVDAIYQNLFGRGAEPGGLQYWGLKLSTQALSVSNMVSTIAGAAMDADAAAFQNKVRAATAFTAALDTSEEMLGYGGAVTLQAGRDWLDGVDSDASLAAATAPAALNAAIAAVLRSGEVAQGRSVVLSTGIDTFTGTAHADSFKAPAQSSTGVAITTLGSHDLLDGGDGVDSLMLVATADQNHQLVGTVRNIERITITGSDYINYAQTPDQIGAVAQMRDMVAAAQAAYDLAVRDDAALDSARTARVAADAAAVAASADCDAAFAVVSALDDPDVTDVDSAVRAAAAAAVVTGSDADNAVASAVVAAAGAAGASLATLRATARVALGGYDDAMAVKAQVAGAAKLAENAAAVTANATDVNQLSADLDARKAQLAMLEAAAGQSTVDASFFAGATEFTIDGRETSLINLGAQRVTLNANTVELQDVLLYQRDVTAADVVLGNAAGTLTVEGDDLAALNLSGSLDASQWLVVTGAPLARVTLAMTGDAGVQISSPALESIISTGSGRTNLYLPGGSHLSNVQTGSGDDAVSAQTRSARDVPGTAVDEAITARVALGDGNDELQLWASGDGRTVIDLGNGDDRLFLGMETDGEHVIGALTLNAGAGDDTVALTGGLATTLTTLSATGADTTADVTLSGGAGRDTLEVFDGALSDATYERLAGRVSEFEQIEFKSNISVDAGKLSQFDTLVFTNDGAATGLAAAQKVIGAGSMFLTAAGFVPAVADDPATGGVNESAPAVYAGTVQVTVAPGYGMGLRANAARVKLDVLAERDDDGYAHNAYGTIYESNLQTLDVQISSLYGIGEEAGVEAVSNFAFQIRQDSTDLQSIRVSGAGAVTINNMGPTAPPQGHAVTVDLSGMTEFLDRNAEGQSIDAHGNPGYRNLSTSTVDANPSIAESIVLGGAHDLVYTTSTGAVMDTVTGFALVAGAQPGTADLARSDLLLVAAGGFAKLAIDAGNSTLTLALDQAAKSAADRLVFTSGGDTYVYVDRDGEDGAATAYDASQDQLVKLVGLYDLDQLVDLLDAVNYH